MTLIAALEEAAQYASGHSDVTPEQLSEEQIARKNQQSLAQLDQMMKGVQ